MKCAVCGCKIKDQDGGWTLTAGMFRVHFNPDVCIANLHPDLERKWNKENPRFQLRTSREGFPT